MRCIRAAQNRKKGLHSVVDDVILSKWLNENLCIIDLIDNVKRLFVNWKIKISNLMGIY